MRCFWLLMICMVLVGCNSGSSIATLKAKYPRGTYVKVGDYNTMKYLYVIDMYYDSKDKTFKYLLYDVELGTYLNELRHEEMIIISYDEEREARK